MKLQDQIRADRTRREYADELQVFIQDSSVGGESLTFWGGPLPEGDDLALVTAQLIRQYTSDNVLGQVCNDHVNAVMGKEPTWEIDPLDDKANKALTEWYKRQEIHELFQLALFTLMFARLEDGKRKTQQTSSILRAYIPSRAVDDNGRANFPDLESALLGGVRLMHPEPGSAGMLRDDDGEVIGGYYAYTEIDALTLERRNLVEVVALDTEIERQGWGFLNDHVPDKNNPQTVIQQRKDLDGELQSEIMYPLGGMLTMFEMTRRPFVTGSMLEQQKSHNANETYMNMGGGAATFLERVFTNVQVPGKWVEVNGEKVFDPDPLAYGPNTVNHLKGLERKNADGSITRETPGVYYHDPTGPGAFISTSEHRVRTIYKMANMLHLLIAGDATASGVARQQAAEAFESSLGLTVTQAKSALEWALRLALQLGGYLSNQGGRYLNTSIDPRINVRTTKPTPDEIRVAIELYKESIISRAEAMRRAGIEDEDVQLEQIEAEEAANPEPVVPVALETAGVADA